MLIPNARRRLANGRRINLNISISQLSNEQLFRLGNGNQSAAVEALIEWYVASDADQPEFLTTDAVSNNAA
jgi:hypothetical protein